MRYESLPVRQALEFVQFGERPARARHSGRGLAFPACSQGPTSGEGPADHCGVIGFPALIGEIEIAKRGACTLILVENLRAAVQRRTVRRGSQQPDCEV